MVGVLVGWFWVGTFTLGVSPGVADDVLPPAEMTLRSLRTAMIIMTITMISRMTLPQLDFFSAFSGSVTVLPFDFVSWVEGCPLPIWLVA